MFLAACIREYTHNYLHCIIDLTQQGCHTLRFNSHYTGDIVRKIQPTATRIQYVQQAHLLSTDFMSCKVSLPAANQRAASVIVNNVGD